jgi:hypothetical protein
VADTMRAVVLDRPGPVENLQIRELPVPEPRPGWAAGTASLGPIRVHRLDDIRAAHTDLEHNRTFGKHVVLTDPDASLALATPPGPAGS